MPSDTKDPLVALACASNGHVLVSHDNDFREVAKRLNVTQAQYRQVLHRVDLRCEEPEAAGRVLDALSLIEHEWLLCQSIARPMVVEVRSSSIRVVR